MDQRPETELNGFIIDLIYYAFARVQSLCEFVNENRYCSESGPKQAVNNRSILRVLPKHCWSSFVSEYV